MGSGPSKTEKGHEKHKDWVTPIDPRGPPKLDEWHCMSEKCKIHGGTKNKEGTMSCHQCKESKPGLPGFNLDAPCWQKGDYGLSGTYEPLSKADKEQLRKGKAVQGRVKRKR
ncbi:hypothetical protein N431DRAFT_443361 [Stipitochalara longipes BDJ]|nr:hypothetical protein N431DRAFT_443361 [Stipitochalara longipes BDJ]